MIQWSHSSQEYLVSISLDDYTYWGKDPGDGSGAVFQGLLVSQDQEEGQPAPPDHLLICWFNLLILLFL